MITKIEVDGFKSLSNFELKLERGLNILVGPNGAGKTNIILYFEFLSKLVSNQLGTAISMVGGAGSIFQKIGEQDYVETIKSKISGCYELRTNSFVIYEYSFEIKISFQKDTVFYNSQQIKLRKTNKFYDFPDKKPKSFKWDVDIKFNYPDNEKSEIEVIAYDSKRFKARYAPFPTSSRKVFIDNLKKFVLNNGPEYNSLIRCIMNISLDEVYSILVDLRGGETFNLVPSKIRELEDSATPPGIQKDGSGLATTLYAMKRNKHLNLNRGIRIRMYEDQRRSYFPPDTLDRVIRFLKLANSTIAGIDVDNDPFDNKLKIKVSVKSGNYEAILPLSAMSDGTIKWLSLITAILTSKTIFSIEEPENFLHPWMQGEITSIMRDHINEKPNHSFVIMTTHSESLLNFAKSDEIILVDLSGGSTKAKRIKNQKAINDEISKSGFGLGHFYFSNSLTNA